MVATDVASRGIGMIDYDFAHPLPSPLLLLTSCGSVYDALLSAIFRCVSVLLWSRLVVSCIGCLAMRTLDIQCSVACHASFPVSLRTNWVQRRIGLFLNCSSCISTGIPDKDDLVCLGPGLHEICRHCREPCWEPCR